MRLESSIIVKPTIEDLLANFHPKILRHLIIQIDPLGQEEYEGRPPKH
jgi:hypothetical protein